MEKFLENLRTGFYCKELVKSAEKFSSFSGLSSNWWWVQTVPAYFDKGPSFNFLWQDFLLAHCHLVLSIIPTKNTPLTELLITSLPIPCEGWYYIQTVTAASDILSLLPQAGPSVYMCICFILKLMWTILHTTKQEKACFLRSLSLLVFFPHSQENTFWFLSHKLVIPMSELGTIKSSIVYSLHGFSFPLYRIFSKSLHVVTGSHSIYL